MFENSDIHNLKPGIVRSYINNGTVRVQMELRFRTEMTLDENNAVDKAMVDDIRKSNENSDLYKNIQSQLSSRLLDGILDFLDISYEEVIKAALVESLSVSELQSIVGEYDHKKGKL